MLERRWFEFWPELLPKEIDYPDVTLLEILETSARRFPEKTAINYYGNEITYSELLDEVENLATCLAENGISKGDRVAIYMQNSPQWVISYFGILRANAVVVPVNPMFTEREVDYPLSDTSCEMAITTSELYDNISPVAEDLGIKIICGHHPDYIPENPDLPPPESIKIEREDISGAISWENAVASKDPPKISIENEDLSMIPYTAGTTGVPKGCKHTHSTVISTTVGSVSWNNMTSGAVSLSSLPFFHVTGLIHSLLAPIYSGGKMVILARWDKETAIQAIEKYRCTHWTNISTMLVDMLSSPDIEERDLDSLCLIGGGGASLPEAIGKKLEDLTGLEYAEGYGMTETISQTHMNPPQRPKLQCLGIPHFQVDALIIDQETDEVLPPNKKGELVVNGPQIFKGYWNKPEKTEESFIEINGKEYFRTGDLCYMDEEGYFFIVDRVKRMINRAGQNVWPADVENRLYEHPSIEEVCIVKTPDERVGEEVKAYVVLKPDAGEVSEKDIISWARERMAPYKYPREVEFVEELPKSGAGKILWRELEEKESKKEK